VAPLFYATLYFDILGYCAMCVCVFLFYIFARIHNKNKMPCYRREYRAMRLQISVHIKVFSGSGRFSLQ